MINKKSNKKSNKKPNKKSSKKPGKRPNKKPGKKPNKKPDNNTNNKIQHLIPALWLAGFLTFSFHLSPYIHNYAEGKREYKELNLSISKSNSEKNEFSPIQNEKLPESYLQNLNPDYIFWLYIPGTAVNYPVARNAEPGYYLTHTFQGTENPCGSLFVQEEVKDLNHGNTIIFGHNMKDGSMFADLKNYKNQNFYSSHQTIQIHYKGKWQKCNIFSCQIREEEDLQCYQTDFSDPKEKQEFIHQMKVSSLYDIQFQPSENRPIITLSTCYGRSKRMIVQAVLM